MTRRGLEGGQYKPLTAEDIEKIHKTSLRVFSEVGVQVNSSEARELFKKAGAKVHASANIVTFPEDVVKATIKTAPSTVNLAGRDDTGALDCTIGGKKVYMGTGGTALNVLDPGATDVRRSELKDVMNMARCVEALENIHFYMLNVYPNDLRDDEKAVDVNRFGAALNRTRKHIMGGVYTVDGVRNVIKMAEIIAGSPEKLRERPIISMVTCLVSPFKMDELYSTLTMEVARQGIPVVVPAEPLCGATAPITLAGNLVIQNVDSLSGIMLAQLTNPGTPSIYGCISSITDLSDMKYLSGAVEMGMMNAAAAQMAQFYKLPFYATAGMTDSKVNDAQAGYESSIGSLMAALAGANFIHDAAGFIEFCMTASFEKLVIDNEILGMVMRAVEGITVNDTTLAFDEIKKVGPGGHFVSSRHTRRYMHTEQYRPQLSDRLTREQWSAAGSMDARARAIVKAKALLEQQSQPILTEQVRARIKKEIPDIRPFIMEA
jgi:trimethylamine--corrinoid protein Co-methyltransferase